mgnify:CR=1 FL=1
MRTRQFSNYSAKEPLLLHFVNNPLGLHADAYANNYSEAENQHFTQQFGELTSRFAAELAAGTPFDSGVVQDLVRQHYEFCSQFWTPTREAYKSLALSYIVPSPYHDAYEAVAPGLAQYHYDAIVIWADANLK